MTSLLVNCVKKIVAYIAAVAVVLGMISGCVAAIEWGTQTFGRSRWR